MQGIKKIVITGPESTGKSTLAEQLADHYQTSWCNEFAREYLQHKGTNYSYEDLLEIAKGQLQMEDEGLRSARNGLYFVDTDMYVMKIWSEVRFEKADKWILQQIATRQYDMYILCDTDLEWAFDHLREHEDHNDRKRLFRMYMDALINDGTPWNIVSGKENERLQKAIEIINKTFSLSY